MKPTSILGRYLIKQILINFIAVLLMVTGVILMFEIIELLRRTADRPDVDMIFVMKMAFSKMPRTFEMVFPFIMMIAAMVTFWKVSRSNEFVIIRAAGVSIWGFLTPLLAAVFMVGIINITRFTKRLITASKPRIRKRFCFPTKGCGSGKRWTTTLFWCWKPNPSVRRGTCCCSGPSAFWKWTGSHS